MTRYGAVQVQITVANGKITKATVIQVPWNDPRDQEINSQAVPMLNDEVVQRQSASIDMVSGATFTSRRLHPVAAVGDRPGAPVSAA